MDDSRDQTFAAWVQAERQAYEAVHQLHQHTQGGRIAPTQEALAAVLAVRRQANHQLARLTHPQPAAPRRPRSVPAARPATRDLQDFLAPSPTPLAAVQMAL